MIKALLAWSFKIAGWRVDGEKPDLKKYVVIVAPHTSNIDFFVGWSARNVIGFYPNFLAKQSLFKIPLVGAFLRFIGGVPVDRSKNTNLVDQVVELYESRERFIMTITPEGTRSYSPNWKTGFYRIAEKANVPIVKIGFDYATKTVFLDKPYYVQGRMEEEIEEIKKYFIPMQGKNPADGVK